MTLDRVTRNDRELVRIVVADPDRHLRMALRQAFLYAGFKSVQDVGTVETLKEVLEEGTPDLLLVAAKLPDGDGCAVVRNLRHSKVGRNPFLSVIVTAWPEECEDVGRMINSGTDHVVLKPVAPLAVFERMEAIIERRRPFVATATYLGPDRRTNTRPEDAEIPLFEVPNTLRMRAQGKSVDTLMLQRAIDQSMDKINGEMIRRQAFHLVFLIERATPLLQAGGSGGPPLVAEIALCAHELSRRLEADLHGHVMELCRTLDNHLASALQRCGGGSWDDHDLTVAKKLCQAVYVGLHNHPDLSELAHKVSQAVGNFESRQTRRAKPSTPPPPVIRG